MSSDGSGRDAILNTSARLFSQRGFTGVSIRDIAQACGVTNAALYYHFRNKEDLFLAMLRRDHEQAMAALRQAAGGPGDLRDDLRLLVAQYADITCRRRQSFQTLWRDLHHVDAARGHKLFGEMQASFIRPLEERLEAAQAAGEIRPGDARLYARLLHGMIIALTHERQPGKAARATPQDVAAVVDVFLDGVKRDA